MVQASFSMDEGKRSASLRVHGHAGANIFGADIVCSAASILAYTLAQNVLGHQNRGQLKYKPKIRLDEGDANISCRAKDDEAYNEILHTFIVIQAGYALLAHNYPQYVGVDMFGEASEEA